MQLSIESAYHFIPIIFFGRQRYASAVSSGIVGQGILLLVIGASCNEGTPIVIVSGPLSRQDHGRKLFLATFLKKGADGADARISYYNGAKIMFFSVGFEKA